MLGKWHIYIKTQPSWGHKFVKCQLWVSRRCYGSLKKWEIIGWGLFKKQLVLDWWVSFLLEREENGGGCVSKGMDRGLPSSFLTHVLSIYCYTLDSGLKRKSESCPRWKHRCGGSWTDKGIKKKSMNIVEQVRGVCRSLQRQGRRADIWVFRVKRWGSSVRWKQRLGLWLWRCVGFHHKGFVSW